MAQMEIVENPNVTFHGQRIYRIQCIDRWSGNCLNKDCWAFQNINGYYCCAKNGFAENLKMQIYAKDGNNGGELYV